jgi:hypothetical protein
MRDALDAVREDANSPGKGTMHSKARTAIMPHGRHPGSSRIEQQSPPDFGLNLKNTLT